MASLLLAVSALGLLAALAGASQGAGVTPADVEDSLISELLALVRQEPPGELHSALRPVFAALPKTPQGHLGHQAARYALHRVFSLRRGWRIKGLEPAGGAAGASKQTLGADAEGWVPSHLQRLLEERLGGKGLPLRELAALAEALQALVLREAALEGPEAARGPPQERECRALKHSLLELEGPQAGRVPLADFLQRQPNESAASLRALGALDEAEAEVLLPNYLAARPHCDGASSLHARCCPSECDRLLGRLEHPAAAPTVQPGRLAELVVALPSATVEAPRQLHAGLLGRLEEVAARHGGEVPLHGRPFAEWLHHAFPRECPLPRIDGPALVASEWLQEGSAGPTDEEFPWPESSELLAAAKTPLAPEAVAVGRWPQLLAAAAALAGAVAALPHAVRGEPCAGLSPELGRTCAALCLLCAGALAADLLDVGVLLCALALGLAALALARLAPGGGGGTSKLPPDADKPQKQEQRAAGAKETPPPAGEPSGGSKAPDGTKKTR